MRVRIGLDIGKDGFISIKVDDQIEFQEIPLIGKEIDIRKLDDYFKIIKEWIDQGADVHCVFEDVHAIFGSSAKGTFSFGKCRGLIEGLLVSNRVPYTPIQPKKWQKVCWEGTPIQKKTSSTGKTQVTDTKKTSLIAAKRLFPGVDFRKNDRCKVPHDGKVDSTLMMYYCDKTF